MYQTELFSDKTGKPPFKIVGGGHKCKIKSKKLKICGEENLTIFDKVISLENLFLAWEKFRQGKMRKRDVLAFGARLENNLFTLHEELRTEKYCHDSYQHFYVHDPKRRYISKATVKDRIIHQAVTQIIEPLFERTFIFDSYAGRKGKGVHAAVLRFEHFLRQASKNYQHKVYALQCGIRKFYDSVRHDILLGKINEVVRDERLFRLLDIIVESYSVDRGGLRGLPLGNVTSQLFTNIYLNEFDHFVKEKLRLRWYARFCDDFVIVHQKKGVLGAIIPQLQKFLFKRCALRLHPNKARIRKVLRGIDFLGYILRTHYHVIRTRTKRRIFQRMRFRTRQLADGAISQEEFRQSLQSCFGMLKHGSNYKTYEKLREEMQKSFNNLQKL